MTSYETLETMIFNNPSKVTEDMIEDVFMRGMITEPQMDNLIFKLREAQNGRNK